MIFVPRAYARVYMYIYIYIYIFAKHAARDGGKAKTRVHPREMSVCAFRKGRKQTLLISAIFRVRCAMHFGAYPDARRVARGITCLRYFKLESGPSDAVQRPRTQMRYVLFLQRAAFALPLDLSTAAADAASRSRAPYIG